MREFILFGILLIRTGHLINMKNKFIFCGMIGWALEICWTGIHSLNTGSRDLMGSSSILMFPIYGCAAIISPLSKLYKNFNFFFRGIIYMSHIYLGEYVYGRFLKKHQICPWDYSTTKYHLDGLIRLDFIPVWFFTGLLYEKVLNKMFPAGKI